MKKQFYKMLEEDIEHQKIEHPEYIDLSGFHFPDTITFENDFPKLYLIESCFHGDLIFRKKKSGIIVYLESDFTGMTVKGEADFTSVEFKDSLEAFNIKFMKNVCFRNAVFNYVEFSYVTFNGDADFSYTRFKNGYSEFLFSEFHQNAYFDKSIFEKGGSFWNVWCFEEISFKNAEVKEILYFNDAWLKKGLIIEKDLKIDERGAKITGRKQVPWDF